MPLPLRWFYYFTMRYLRHYPRFLQLILLLLMVFTLVSFSVVVAEFLSVHIFGYHTTQISRINNSSPPSLVNAAKMVQAVGSIFFFFCSAVLFAYLAHPKPAQYLGLRPVRNKVQFLIIPLLMLVCAPILIQMGIWMEYLPFGKDMISSHKTNNERWALLLQMHQPAELLVNLLVFALLPAIGEELLFRGLIMRFSYNSNKNIHAAVLISALIFALAHPDAYNFIPILIAGILLGYIYYLTGSLWMSMLAHFMNNGLQIFG